MRLSSLLLTLNLLAFLFHTVLEIMDDKYKLIRDNLPTRQTFFDDIRALTRYSYFDSWDAMLTFMIHGFVSKSLASIKTSGSPSFAMIKSTSCCSLSLIKCIEK